MYATDEELIDWYPGSSTRQMRSSLGRILALVEAGELDVVLPGHNQVLEDRGEMARHCANFMESGPRWAKVWSRARAKAVLRMNKMVPIRTKRGI